MANQHNDDGHNCLYHDIVMGSINKLNDGK